MKGIIPSALAGNLPPGSLLFQFKLSDWPDLAFVGLAELVRNCAHFSL